MLIFGFTAAALDRRRKKRQTKEFVLFYILGGVRGTSRVLVTFYFWMHRLLTQVCSLGDRSLLCAYIMCTVSCMHARLE